MPMVWQDWTSLNKKYNDAWLAGLGDAGVFGGGNTLQPRAAAAGVGALLTPKTGAGLGALSFSQVQTLQDLLNIENQYRSRPLIEVTGQWDNATCLTVYYYTDILLQGGQVDPFLYDFLYNNEVAIAAACQQVSQAGQAPQPPPTTTTEPPPASDSTSPPITTSGGGAAVPTTTVDPCSASGCDCLVYEGDAGPHIENLQQQLNAALDANGYEPIPVTSTYDKATCGAIFELGGSFMPTYPAVCNNVEGEWVVPLQCPDMVIPKKKGEGGTSRASMFAIGGLLLAAGLGTAYWVSKR